MNSFAWAKMSAGEQAQFVRKNLGAILNLQNPHFKYLREVLNEELFKVV